ncbi:E3 ubiquitin-protein ligase NEDD4-like isoform X2 [Orbicella faveolata]|uniref:E3 ubiquitin-protein ligase NEDD4-like isoform X2 n=1 Tax=Orbicella faveolata TaxID=48498 RepID=UPI0009E5F948|nr:E3 ubiquitin-protein ligase NEDD4-like isoform X2 [Orbicella faveolata]
MDLPPRTNYVVHGLKPSRNPSVKIVRVVVLEGVELAKKDIFGLSDPYCKIKLFRGDREYGEIDAVCTETIKKSLHPVWNQEFLFRVNPRDNRLLFEVFDENRITRDDFLGEVELPLLGLPTEGPSVQIRPRDYSVRPRSSKSRVKGYLKLQLSFLASGDSLVPQSETPATDATTDTNLRLVENHYPVPSSNVINSVPDAANAELPVPSAPPLSDHPSLPSLSELIQVGFTILCFECSTFLPISTSLQKRRIFFAYFRKSEAKARQVQSPSRT